MRRYEVILFDLDGTLSDPKEGITKSVQYALERFGVVEPDLAKLERFIGPPLQVSFSEAYGFDEEEAKKAIRYYRERFTEKGMFENVVYPGIPLLLKELKGRGYKLLVATSKPTVFAKEILKYFKLDLYFDEVVGSHLDGTRIAKADLIQYIIDRNKDYEKDAFVMIGDRKHDIIGAQTVGMDSIGVAYGYGSLVELRQAGPTHIAERVEELQTLLMD
jgi:phosphoglycolate phosphatase